MKVKELLKVLGFPFDMTSLVIYQFFVSVSLVFVCVLPFFWPT